MTSKFWALQIEPGKKYTQTPDLELAITQAVLTADARDESARTVVEVEVNKNTFTVCSLRLKTCEQTSLDLIFDAGQPLTFKVIGPNAVQLLGYYVDEQPFDEHDDYEDSEEEGEEEEAENEEGDDNQEEEEEEAEEEDGENEDEPQKQLFQDKKAKQQGKGQQQLQQQQQQGNKKRKSDETMEVSPQTPSKIVGSAQRVEIKTPGGSKDQTSPFTPAGEGKQQKQQQQQQQQQKKQKNEPTSPATNSAGAGTPKKGGLRVMPSGLQFEDLQLGNGKAVERGKKVSVKYVGKLPNGKVFDASLQRPFVFRLGTGQVIEGWDQGIAGMRVGGKRRLVIPPALAYGARGAPPAIPPNATLHFEVEVAGV